MIIGNVAIIRGKKVSYSKTTDDHRKVEIIFKTGTDYRSYKVNKYWYQTNTPTIYKYVVKQLDTLLLKLLTYFNLEKPKLYQAKEIIPLAESCDYKCDYKIPDSWEKVSIEEIIKTNKV